MALRAKMRSGHRKGGIRNTPHDRPQTVCSCLEMKEGSNSLETELLQYLLIKYSQKVPRFGVKSSTCRLG